MTQLPSSTKEGNREYGAEDTAEDGEGNSPLEVKQSLLHIATSEMLMQRSVYGKFTLVQTDFKWFGPSLPHSTIFAVLEFFHVPRYWIDFFKKFLAMPMVFPDDGPAAAVRMRRCGVPISHTISTALGEAVLFCLDFAVNKATRGSTQLYRFFDDVWFWGQAETCLTAWETLNEFTNIMGLAMNEEKTGSFSVVRDSTTKNKPVVGLPQGQVRWGFLIFDPIEARWIVNEKNIGEHIVELRRQLTSRRTVLAWIVAWNSYISKFFSNNIGQPAQCMGQQHLDMVLAAFERIQREPFASLDSSDVNGAMDIDGNDATERCQDVMSYLKRMISTRCGVKNIPDSFLAFPVDFGGLEVRDPFIPLLALYTKSPKNPKAFLDRTFQEEEEAYEASRAFFYKEGRTSSRYDIPSGVDVNTFFPFAEFVRFREETSFYLRCAYEDLLAEPDLHGAEPTSTTREILTTVPNEMGSGCAFKNSYYNMNEYWRFVLQLYAEEAVECFGGLVLGERDMLPVELMNLLRGERVRWQG